MLYIIFNKCIIVIPMSNLKQLIKHDVQLYHINCQCNTRSGLPIFN